MTRALQKHKLHTKPSVNPVPQTVKDKKTQVRPALPGFVDLGAASRP